MKITMKNRVAKLESRHIDDSRTPLPPITAENLAAIDVMTADELRVLCRRFACQCGIAAMMTDEETAQAMLDVLAETALRPLVPGLNLKADIQNRMNAIDKWLDRTKGKPAQAITQDVNVRGTIVNAKFTDEMFYNMLKRYGRQKGLLIERDS